MNSLNKGLLRACHDKDFTRAIKLLQQGADASIRDECHFYEKTALHWGCEHGRLEFVKLLIETYKCDPQVRDKDLWTPLHYVCRYSGDVHIVQYLICEQGCNSEVRDIYQQTPLNLAYGEKHMNVVQFFIRQQNFNPDVIINSDEQTILHLACQDGHINIVQYLIHERGCNQEVRDKKNQTPLDVAYCNKHMDIVCFLVRHSNISLDHMNTSHPQETLLHRACRDGHLEIAQCLISELHYDVNVPNKRGNTPLHCAYIYEVVKFLITKGKCNPDLANNDGDTALHIASENNNLVMVKILINEGKCNPDLCNNGGDTALHIACRNDHTRPVSRTLGKGLVSDISVLKYLLEEGNSNPNIRNKNGLTPLELTSDPEKIRELIRHGANPTNVYKTHSKVVETKKPLQPPVKVFVVGNPSAGKSTLTASLKKEKSVLARALTSVQKVSGIDENTAGVIPHEYKSKKCGYVSLYDFAGQPEFYSSHAALLQNAIQTSPPIFLLVVDLCESDEEMKQTILYWLSFLENQCTSVSSKPHVIIVGSHADILRTRGEDPNVKSSVIVSLQKSYQFNKLYLSEFIVLDCQYSESAGMSELRKYLKKSCDSLRTHESININAHCFFVYLLDKFGDSTAIAVKDIIPNIQRGKESATKSNPLFFLPISTSALCSLCDELNDRGHILFLKDTVCLENSWVIIDKAAMLSEVTGTIFAPENFKQHCKLASSTGVVPVSNLAKTFPQHNLEMLIGFLSHLEFCHEVTDQEVLQLANDQHWTTSEEVHVTCSFSDRYLLFPALISLDIPSKVWESNPHFHHHCGWILQCCQPQQFFTSRFLQVVLLRLAFKFAFPHKQDFPALLRKCSLWRNGIYWGNRDGVETLVEVVEQNKAVIVLMRCTELTPEYLQLRSSVIQKVLAAASEFCGTVDTIESLIDPSEIIKYPLKPTSHLTLFSLAEVAEAIANTKPAVVSSTGQTMLLNKLGLKVENEHWRVFHERNPQEIHMINVHSDQIQQCTDQLILGDLSKARKAIWDARLKWYDIGVEVGVSVITLDVIERNYPRDVDSCFTAMLKEWLKTNPTWSSLVEALKSPPVDYPQLAEEVFTNYVNTTTTTDNELKSGY